MYNILYMNICSKVMLGPKSIRMMMLMMLMMVMMMMNFLESVRIVRTKINEMKI